MPIHDFGPLKKIEDAEKEIEDGKAQEIKDASVRKSTRESNQNMRSIPKETLRDEPEPKQERLQENVKMVKKSGKSKITKASHPLVHGDLEIEEEEL